MEQPPRRTGYVYHELYLWHSAGDCWDNSPNHSTAFTLQPLASAESPESKRRFNSILEVSGLRDQLVGIRPRHATDEELLRVHDGEYLQRLDRLSLDGGGDAGESAPFRPGGYEIAKLSCGGVLRAVEAVLDGEVGNAYALVRPPGHHAERGRGRGFCLLSNVAVAARHALERVGVGRVAIVDWDVHHGNGTQQAFWDDPDVLERNYPGDSGGVGETGGDAGLGTTVNVPLPAGSGHPAYLDALDRVVLPALRAFRPDLVLVSCGFDAAIDDPLARMMCTSDTFRAMTERVVDAAGELCGGRLVLAHEGGYSANYVPFCGLATVEALCGARTEVRDPYAEDYAHMNAPATLPHQAEAIDRAARHVGAASAGWGHDR